jgi:hypothetical protein
MTLTIDVSVSGRSPSVSPEHVCVNGMSEELLLNSDSRRGDGDGRGRGRVSWRPPRGG